MCNLKFCHRVRLYEKCLAIMAFENNDHNAFCACCVAQVRRLVKAFDFNLLWYVIYILFLILRTYFYIPKNLDKLINDDNADNTFTETFPKKHIASLKRDLLFSLSVSELVSKAFFASDKMSVSNVCC